MFFCFIMSNIHQSIIEMLTALNIYIYHYEEIVRCYALAKFNIEHSGKLDYTDGVHSAEFDADTGEDLITVDIGKLRFFDDLCFFKPLLSSNWDKSSAKLPEII